MKAGFPMIWPPLDGVWPLSDPGLRQHLEYNGEYLRDRDVPWWIWFGDLEGKPMVIGPRFSFHGFMICHDRSP